jgi:hypothetical protein
MKHRFVYSFQNDAEYQWYSNLNTGHYSFHEFAFSGDDPKEFPILRQSGPMLFDKFDRHYKEGLDLIVCGGKVKEIPKA